MWLYIWDGAWASSFEVVTSLLPPSWVHWRGNRLHEGVEYTRLRSQAESQISWVQTPALTLTSYEFPCLICKTGNHKTHHLRLLHGLN